VCFSKGVCVYVINTTCDILFEVNLETNLCGSCILLQPGVLPVSQRSDEGVNQELDHSFRSKQETHADVLLLQEHTVLQTGGGPLWWRGRISEQDCTSCCGSVRDAFLVLHRTPLFHHPLVEAAGPEAKLSVNHSI
jgi:hypothetical protein